jgi:cytochrome c oxidase subunit 2
MKRSILRLSMLAACASMLACAGNESVLDAGGPQAHRIDGLWWYMFWTAAIVWVLVAGTLMYALRKGRDRKAADAGDEMNRTLRRPVSIATGLTVAILIATLAYDIFTGEALASLPRDKALRIQITGHQWWWEAQYIDPVPSNAITTANEIHIPVGEPVQIIGSSADVIHSVWIPSLAGKKDLIPGHATAMWLQADKPGIYRGQCAEFCGHQHAKMALLVKAEPRDQFNSWYNSQRLPSAAPSDSISKAGERIFMSKGCPLCHTVGGTLAGGRIGPPLTHIGSAYTLAAGSLKNTRDNLAAWIADPQAIKPGAHMPANDLSGQELQSIVSYLGSLK